MGNGRRTAFWLDTWLGDQPLAELCPALFSHALNQNIPVSSALIGGKIRNHLRTRLTIAAEVELLNLLDRLTIVTLDPSLEDARYIRGFPSTHPSSAVYYRGSLSHLPDDLFAPCIWRNDAPPKVSSLPLGNSSKKA